MKVIADTNVLVRYLVRDDPRQAEVALDALRRATLLAVPLAVLCELSWVLTRGYRFTPSPVATAIRHLTESSVVVSDSAAVEAGLAMLSKGGDFADGVIAHDGRALGGEMFLTFDSRAASRLLARGAAVELLG